MKKIAILFGNDKYDFERAQLQCAVNDAKALEDKLWVLDFETKSILNYIAIFMQRNRICLQSNLKQCIKHCFTTIAKNSK